MTPVLDTRKLLLLEKASKQRLEASYIYMPLLAAAIAGRNEGAMRMIMDYALRRGVRYKTVDEIVLQSHLFLGFPAMIEASRLLAEVRPRGRNTKNLPQAYSEKDCQRWHREGMAKIRKIYGALFDRLMPYINSFSPQILTWMINEGYGKVLSRPGASFKLRELSIVATLTVTAYENQLMAHIRGAYNSGLEASVLEGAIDNCRYFCPQGNIKRARTILRQVTD